MNDINEQLIKLRYRLEASFQETVKTLTVDELNELDEYAEDTYGPLPSQRIQDVFYMYSSLFSSYNSRETIQHEKRTRHNQLTDRTTTSFQETLKTLTVDELDELHAYAGDTYAFRPSKRVQDVFDMYSSVFYPSYDGCGMILREKRRRSTLVRS